MYPNKYRMNHGSLSKAVGVSSSSTHTCSACPLPCVVSLDHVCNGFWLLPVRQGWYTTTDLTLQSELTTQNQARSSYTGNRLVPLSESELCFFILSRELLLFSCPGLGTLKIEDLHRLGYVCECLLPSHIKSFSFNATIPGSEICAPSSCSTPLGTISRNLWRSHVLAVLLTQIQGNMKCNSPGTFLAARSLQGLCIQERM